MDVAHLQWTMSNRFPLHTDLDGKLVARMNVHCQGTPGFAIICTGKAWLCLTRIRFGETEDGYICQGEWMDGSRSVHILLQVGVVILDIGAWANCASPLRVPGSRTFTPGAWEGRGGLLKPVPAHLLKQPRQNPGGRVLQSGDVDLIAGAVGNPMG